LALVGKANKRNIEIEHIHEILDRKIGGKKKTKKNLCCTYKQTLLEEILSQYLLQRRRSEKSERARERTRKQN
jgi:hypothetical protein